MDGVAAAQPASAPGDEMVTFAQVALGGLTIGIEAAHVVRALPRPAVLAQLPRSSRAIDGVFSDGSQVVPLVDLRRWMDGGSAEGVPGHVMVIGSQGRAVGLAIDEILGLVRVPRSRIRKVQHDDGPEAFFHSVATLHDGVSLLGLLDPLRLMEQVQAWADHAGESAAEDAAEACAPRAALQQFALVRLARTLLAVPSRHVSEVVRQPPVQPLDLGGSQVTGIVQWRGEQMPLLANAASLGIEGNGEGASALTLLLGDGTRCVALPIDEVVAMEAIDEADVQPAGDAGLAPYGAFKGLARTAGGETALLLDTAALLDKYGTAGLSGDSAAGIGANDKRLQPNEEALTETHIVVSAGQDRALAIGSVHEIIALPPGFSAIPAAADGVAGSCDWRERPIPVLDLRGGPQDAASSAPNRLVVVQHGERRAALLVDDLVELLPRNAGTRSRFKLASGATMDMVTVGRPPARKSYQVLELGELPFFAAAAA
jgi:chemotaxis signal transduction protein